MSKEFTDKAIDVRNEDRLDKHKLSIYLSKHLKEVNICDDLLIKQYPGGASNLTYLLDYKDQQFILRTAPHGANIKGAHDMHREFKVLDSLKDHFPYAPKALLYCQNDDIIGREFYIMQKINGIIPRKSFPMPVSKDLAHQMCTDLIDVHVALHEIDIKKTGLINLGKAKGYINRQVTGWNKRYVNAMTDDSLDASTLMQWLDHNQADDEDTTLIHNDYKFDNVVFSPNHPHKIMAVLDWEMTTIGSPLMDLGCSLAYWIEKNDPPAMQSIRMMPTNIDGMMTREDVVKYYFNKRGLKPRDFNYFYVFGLFRLAVIVQQIFKRYHLGQTKNPAFAPFGHIAQLLIQRAQSLIIK